MHTLTCLLRATALAAAAGLPVVTTATELVYTPVNPTFGGNPNNAVGLLSIANAQNDYKPPPAPAATLTPLQQFNQRLQSAVLNRLSVSALNDLYDADGRLIIGRTITAGNYVISFAKDPEGNLVLTTEDRAVPGSSTQIILGNVPTIN